LWVELEGVDFIIRQNKDNNNNNNNKCIFRARKVLFTISSFQSHPKTS